MRRSRKQKPEVDLSQDDYIEFFQILFWVFFVELGGILITILIKSF